MLFCLLFGLKNLFFFLIVFNLKTQSMHQTQMKQGVIITHLV